MLSADDGKLLHRSRPAPLGIRRSCPFCRSPLSTKAKILKDSLVKRSQYHVLHPVCSYFRECSHCCGSRRVLPGPIQAKMAWARHPRNLSARRVSLHKFDGIIVSLLKCKHIDLSFSSGLPDSKSAWFNRSINSCVSPSSQRSEAPQSRPSTGQDPQPLGLIIGVSTNSCVKHFIWLFFPTVLSGAGGNGDAALYFEHVPFVATEPVESRGRRTGGFGQGVRPCI